MLWLIALFPPSALAADDPGWLPLGRSELHAWADRRSFSWRDARVVEGPILAFAAAVDGQGRILVATATPVEDGGGALSVRTHTAAGWTSSTPIDARIRPWRSSVRRGGKGARGSSPPVPPPRPAPSASSSHKLVIT